MRDQSYSERLGKASLELNSSVVVHAAFGATRRTQEEK